MHYQTLGKKYIAKSSPPKYWKHHPTYGQQNRER